MCRPTISEVATCSDTPHGPEDQADTDPVELALFAERLSLAQVANANELLSAGGEHARRGDGLSSMRDASAQSRTVTGHSDAVQLPSEIQAMAQFGRSNHPRPGLMSRVFSRSGRREEAKCEAASILKRRDQVTSALQSPMEAMGTNRRHDAPA
jgi:hypothetical protein